MGKRIGKTIVIIALGFLPWAAIVGFDYGRDFTPAHFTFTLFISLLFLKALF
ncbi:MAG: hypothetical protein GX349_07000 [Firmicutes bacterium]|nr:hypothetical protein [Bacillota bacterium]